MARVRSCEPIIAYHPFPLLHWGDPVNGPSALGGVEQTRVWYPVKKSLTDVFSTLRRRGHRRRHLAPTYQYRIDGALVWSSTVLHLILQIGKLL